MLDRAVEKAGSLGLNPATTGVRHRSPFNGLPYWLYRATEYPARICSHTCGKSDRP